MTRRRPHVAVLDYGSGNLRSVEKALQRGGADTVVTADPETALQAGGLVVPGVGAFAACMTGLRAVRGDQVIDRRLAGTRSDSSCRQQRQADTTTFRAWIHLPVPPPHRPAQTAGLKLPSHLIASLP